MIKIKNLIFSQIFGLYFTAIFANASLETGQSFYPHNCCSLTGLASVFDCYDSINSLFAHIKPNVWLSQQIPCCLFFTFLPSIIHTFMLPLRDHKAACSLSFINFALLQGQDRDNDQDRPVKFTTSR